MIIAVFRFMNVSPAALKSVVMYVTLFMAILVSILLLYFNNKDAEAATVVAVREKYITVQGEQSLSLSPRKVILTLITDIARQGGLHKLFNCIDSIIQSSGIGDGGGGIIDKIMILDYGNNSNDAIDYGDIIQQRYNSDSKINSEFIVVTDYRSALFRVLNALTEYDYWINWQIDYVCFTEEPNLFERLVNILENSTLSQLQFTYNAFSDVSNERKALVMIPTASSTFANIVLPPKSFYSDEDLSTPVQSQLQRPPFTLSQPSINSTFLFNTYLTKDLVAYNDVGKSSLEYLLGALFVNRQGQVAILEAKSASRELRM